MKQEAVFFPSPAGRLAGVIHHPCGDSRGCVITCHGLLSSKDSDKFTTLGEYFAEEGLTVLRFDFSGCGESEGSFEDTTITQRYEDLIAALTFMQSRLPSDAQSIGLLGSSMGGYVSLLAASRYEAVTAVVAWATPFDFEDLHEAINLPTAGRMKEAFYRDARRYRAGDFVPLVRNLLIIHGDCDESVPVAHAYRLYQDASDRKQLVIIPGADHRFSNRELREKAVRLSLNWFKKYPAPGRSTSRIAALRSQ